MSTAQYMTTICLGWLVLASSGALSQTATPPHCDCPGAHPGGAQSAHSSGTHGATTNSAHGAATAARHERAASEHHQSGETHNNMAPPRMKMICTNSPRNYSNPCEFVNAQATNNKLGMRPCSATPPAHAAKEHQTGEEMMPKGVCFTDNHTESASDEAVSSKYLQAHKDVGIRCHGACPCKLTCPPKMEEHHMQTHQGKMADDEESPTIKQKPQSEDDEDEDEDEDEEDEEDEEDNGENEE